MLPCRAQGIPTEEAEGQKDLESWCKDGFTITHQENKAQGLVL